MTCTFQCMYRPVTRMSAMSHITSFPSQQRLMSAFIKLCWNFHFTNEMERDLSFSQLYVRYLCVQPSTFTSTSIRVDACRCIRKMQTAGVMLVNCSFYQSADDT